MRVTDRSALDADGTVLRDDVRRLDRRGWYKPLDVGEAGVAASVDAASALTVVTLGHPLHGQVQLTPEPELPVGRRYDHAAVRRYRARLSGTRARSFGLRPRTTADPAGPPARGLVRDAWLWQDAIPLTSMAVERDAGEPAVVTLVPHPDDVGGARSVVQLRLTSGEGAEGRDRWGGRLRLARAPYPQLTEGGPLPPTASRPRLARRAGALVLDDPVLGASVAIGGDMRIEGPAASAVLERGWLAADLPVEADWRALAIGLGEEAIVAEQALRTVVSVEPGSLLRAAAVRWARRWSGWPGAGGPSKDAASLDGIARRGVAYAIGACVIPVAGGTCLVTDHRLLPLAWTRDGYFVARALLDWSVATGAHEPISIVRDHLDWLFTVAQRPDGWWARSHLVGGQRKDAAFQADQQLYPLLELADHATVTGQGDALRAFAEEVPRVVAALDARSHPGTGLIATDESAADDPVPGLHVTSTQVLAWHAFRSLANFGVGGSALAERAERIRAAVHRHLVVSTPEGERAFASAIDAGGRAVLDHDANDVPLALAAEWGFCRPGDPTWLATMRGALGPTHATFHAGVHGGLGSVHTPGAWSLGHLQALVVATTSEPRDRAAAARAMASLEADALWDGSLPEASDPRTGRPISRSWFAWPGALAASRYLASGREPRPAMGA